MQMTSSRNDESTSEAGFIVAECTEEKEDLKKKNNKQANKKTPLKDRLGF